MRRVARKLETARVRPGILLAGFVAALGIAALVDDSFAFRLLKSSIGEELRWKDGTNNLTRNACSIPSGSARADMYYETIDEWNEVGGLRNVFDPTYKDGDSICRVRMGNSRNQVAVVPRSEIDGSAGLKKHANFGRFITETDIFIAADMGTEGPDDPANFTFGGTGSAAGRNTLIHEYGHSLGLDHDDNQLAVMRSFALFGALPGYTEFSSIWPDDLAGARKHYSSGSNESNLVASWQVLYDLLPQNWQDRYDALNGPPPGNQICSAQHDMSYNRRARVPDGMGGCMNGFFNWEVFNPSENTCNNNAAACQSPDTNGYDGSGETDSFGNPNRVIEVCPGDSFHVPVTVIHRRAVFDPAEHRVAFLAGLVDGNADDVRRVFFDGTVDVDHENTGDVTTLVQEVRLVNDVDCWDDTEEYDVWVAVDYCNDISEEREDDSEAEDDNLIRTDVRFRVLDAATCGLAAGNGQCGGVQYCEPGNGGGEPPGYAQCENDGIAAGECAGGPCAPIDDFNDNDALDWESAFHPDGDHSFEEYCANFTENGEMVCNSFNDDYGVCERCGVDTMLGCSCQQDDDCFGFENDLGCFGADFGDVGFCWDQNEGPPIFHCAMGTCSNLGDRHGNDPYYCSHDLNNLPAATCIPWNCPGPVALTCGAQGLICDDNPVDEPDPDDNCDNWCLEDEDCSPAFGWPNGYDCTPELTCELL